MASCAAACDAAAAALAADDPEGALAAAEAAVVLQPESSRAWSLRAQALNELQLFADVLAAVPFMRSLGSDTWQQEAERATTSLQSLFALLPAAMAGTASSDPDERLAAWKELAQADPTSLQARSSIYISWLQEAARLRDVKAEAAARSGSGAPPSAGAEEEEEDEEEIEPGDVARQALACLRECAADAAAYRASEGSEPPPPSTLRRGGAELRAFVQQRRPNVPLSAYGAEAVDKAEALTHLNIGLAIETVAELAELEVSGKVSGEVSGEVSAEVSGVAGSVGSAGGAEPSPSGLARAEACTHYARSAELDSSGSYVFTLWGAAAARDASLESDAARRAAAARVYARGVEAGHWAVAEQRPVTLVRGLTASAWHEPQAFAVCRALEAAFGQIREEALSLLEHDARERLFSSHRSKALEAGDWCDVGLYYNGMRNDSNAARAPLTSALLCSADGEFRRECTSCPLGSAYFSLLRPHTRLAAHCGPTNARLRAHLGLVVPEGDCEIVVGGEARRWAEGKVLLFDDSFEHEVHNETDEARLILLVDLWHPELQTDEQRMAVLPHDEQRERYRGVVERGYYETTTLRGH